MMYVVVWAFRARPGKERAFERAYAGDGPWVALFRRSAGFRGSELLRDATTPGRYLVIDRWESSDAYAAFRAAHAGDYDLLDRECAALTQEEVPLGDFVP